MEIRIRRIGTQAAAHDASDVTTTYVVTDNGREFTITFRTHRYGCNLGIAGEEGFLYTDDEAPVVRRRIVSVGPACGTSVRFDEPVEGLSPWAIRGVTVVERSGRAGEVTLSVTGAEDGTEIPVMAVDGEIIDLKKYL
jgi:hypothetical protein